MANNMANTDKNKHEIRILGRHEASICGVSEVVSFDEEGAHLNTVLGELFIEGEEIKIGALDTDGGVVLLSGRINGFYYSDDRKPEKKGFFSKFSR